MCLNSRYEEALAWKATVFALVGLAAVATTIRLNRNAEDKRLFACGTELPADCNICDPLFCFNPRWGYSMVAVDLGPPLIFGVIGDVRFRQLSFEEVLISVIGTELANPDRRLPVSLSLRKADQICSP